MSKSEQKSPPASLGTTGGLGESFQINLSTGQGTYSYRIPLPDGVAGYTPRLSLEYTHGTGHGAWGLGWQLALRSISRRLDFGPPAEGMVERFLDSGIEIIPIADGSFAAERETSFTRYTREGEGWRIEERTGEVHHLGLTPAARVAPLDAPERVIEWLVERSVDVSGNAIDYAYLFDHGCAYPAAIRYASYEVRFAYEPRPDVRHDGRAGYSRRLALRCSRIRLVLDPGAHERVLRTYDFVYELAPGSGVSLLNEIRHTANGAGIPDVHRPPIRFRYTSFDPRQFHVRWMRSDESAPPDLSREDVAMVTLDDAPLPGILFNRAGRHYYWPNRGDGTWGAPRPIGAAPFASSFERAGLAFVDMNGSGTADLMVANPKELQGYYENGGSEGWTRFVAFPRGRRATPQWNNPNFRLEDVDHDGLVDAMMSQRRAFAYWRNEGAEGWAEPALVPKSDTLAGIDFSDPDVHFADMTGDGSADLVRVRSGRIEYWPSLGHGRFGEPVVMQNSPRLRRDVTRDALLFVDLDGDGCSDLVHVAAGALIVYQNQNGQRFADPVVIDTIPAPLPGSVRALNINGRAGAGLLWNSITARGTGYVQFEFAAAEPPYLLSAVDNGAGLHSTIAYRSAIEDYERDRLRGQRWTTNFPFPYLVVAGTREEDATTGRVCEVELRYSEAHFEARTRQFQGFRSTERIERGDESAPGRRFVHHFLMAQERLPGNGREHASLNGMLERIETYQLDGSAVEHLPLCVETSEHGLALLDTAPDGRTRSFVFVRAHRQEDRERTGDVRVEEKTYAYDARGNVTAEVHRGFGTAGGVAQPERERRMEIAYAAGAAHYILGKQSRIVVRDGSGALLTEKRFYYDGPDFIGLPLGQLDRGLVARQEEWTMTQAELDAHYASMQTGELGFAAGVNADGVPSVFAVTRRSRHDARGLLIAARDPMGTETRSTFSADGLFRILLEEPLGQTRFEYDRAIGQPVRVLYHDGSELRFVYDAQGRVVQSILPGEDPAAAATIYTYDETAVPNKRVARFRQSGGATSVAVTYFDGFGRELQQRIEVEPGLFLVSALKRVNAFGDLREEFEPSFSPSVSFDVPDTAGKPSRRCFYDARGRVVRTVNFNGGVSTAEFFPFRAVFRDANDHTAGGVHFDTPREEEFDVFRSLVRITEHTSAADAVVTTYAIGPLGELLSVSDGRGVKFRYAYDRAGNRIRIVLRESGERKLWYDARGKLIRMLDPAGHDLRATWDASGRQTRLASGAAVLEEYRYDDLAQHAHGRLAEVVYSGGRQRFEYDAAGRLRERVYFYDGEAAPRSLRYEYDALGRETAIVHTDGTRIDRRLTFNGWLKSVDGAIDGIEYDPRGFPAEIAYHNGVRTALAYTPGPGRISAQKTTAPDGSVLQDVTHTFDPMDVMLSRNDTAAGGSGLRTFTYDPLYQLTSAADAAGTRLYEYDAGYNLHRSDEIGATLHYDDAAHPDRLSGVTPDGGAFAAVDYDGNGNVVDLPGQQFAYNAKNELLRFTRADGLVADYRYDHAGLRISRTITDASGAVTRVLYVGDQAEVRNGTPSYFVSIGPIRAAVLTGGTIRFLHDDAIGTTGLVTDASGKPIGRIDSQPFGTPGAASGEIDFRTYSLHPVDPESGLVYMRRRYYAPRIARFLTPDLLAIYQPERVLHSPQGLHLYLFVANDPMNKTDPTGLSFWSVVGGIVGVAAGIVVAALIVASGVGLLVMVAMVFAITMAVAGVSYMVASSVNPDSGFGQFMRGFMIGFNAGMNGVFAGAITGYAAVGIAIGVINFLAVFDTVAQSPVYQGILGWSSWVMPMSWGATALGLGVFLINVYAYAVSYSRFGGGAAKIDKVTIDWKTGSVVMVGGLIRNGTGFNLGNFVYLDPSYLDGSTPEHTYDALLKHETGHTLNLGAFGSVFNLMDFLEENVGDRYDAYGELLAQSHKNDTGEPEIPMWG